MESDSDKLKILGLLQQRDGRLAVEHGHEVLIANTDYQPERMEVCVRRMLERKVDGVAMMTFGADEELLQAIAGRNMPVVSIGLAGLYAVFSMRARFSGVFESFKVSAILFCAAL